MLEFGAPELNYERKQPAREDPNPVGSRRLLSVDALRGFDMFWIMGGDYIVRSLPKIHDSPLTRALAAQMDHCEWAGFHFYDLIFPLFVFIVGVSLVFSIPRMIERDGRPAAIKRIVIRSVILFLLGIFYMGGVANGFKNVYLAGVLHRIAVAYFFAALIFCFLASSRSSLTASEGLPSVGSAKEGLFTMIALCFLLLIGYWALLTFVPLPGIGAPSLAQAKTSRITSTNSICRARSSKEPCSAPWRPSPIASWVSSPDCSSKAQPFQTKRKFIGCWAAALPASQWASSGPRNFRS